MGGGIVAQSRIESLTRIQETDAGRLDRPRYTRIKEISP